MRLRYGWMLCWLACAGCQALGGRPPDAAPDAAEICWRQGQTAMRAGRPELAVECYEKSLAVDPSRAYDHLSLAAAHAECGAGASACVELAQFLEHCPDHARARVQYAEQLWRLGRIAEARDQFERYLADAAEAGETDMRRALHAHSRLMELADKDEDDYSACLHRGIGLFLLAACRAGLSDPDGELPVEGLLCKATGELAQAHELRPAEARPCWYLYLVWQRLAQQQTAARWLRAAADASPDSQLTPAEQRSLQLALRHDEERKPRP